MRIDREIIPFSAIATLGTLADIDLQQAESVAIIIEITSHAGTATNTFVEMVPRIGSTVPPATGTTSDAIGHPGDIAATTGLFPFSRIGNPGVAKTQFLSDGSFITWNNLQQARVRCTLVGAGHTITGNVHVLRRFK